MFFSVSLHFGQKHLHFSFLMKKFCINSNIHAKNVNCRKKVAKLFKLHRTQNVFMAEYRRGGSHFSNDHPKIT